MPVCVCVWTWISEAPSFTHTHTVYKGQRDKGLKAAYGSVPLSGWQPQFHIVCRKQNHVDIYGAGVVSLLLGNLMPSATRLHNPLSLLSSLFSHTHTHTPLHIERSRKHRGSMTFNKQFHRLLWLSIVVTVIICMHTHIHTYTVALKQTSIQRECSANGPEPHKVLNTAVAGCRAAQQFMKNKSRLTRETRHFASPSPFHYMFVYFWSHHFVLMPTNQHRETHCATPIMCWQLFLMP